jgi:maltodextrin utilization protein YvdJ
MIRKNAYLCVIIKTNNIMNTQFNTIETIRTDATITNKSEAYLAACNQFEIEASNFANNENFVSRKSAEEVSISYAKAQSADCEYSVYVNAHACEAWLSKAWNNAD